MATEVLWLLKGLDRGGAERLVTTMAPKLDRSRYRVEVAYLLSQQDGFVADIEAAGITTHCLGARGTMDPRWPGRLRQLLSQRRFPLVHTHSPLPASLARILRPRDTRLVHTEHNVWPSYRWVTRAANAATYSRNAAVISVSDGVTASIEPPLWVRSDRMPGVETLLHGVNPEAAPRGDGARATARAQLGLPEPVPVVGSVGNLTPKKDHAGLLMSLESLRRRVPDVVLLLIGQGPLEGELRSIAADKGLSEHVRFLGSRADVPELLPAFDVFVLGSRFEGLPIALLEAMAAEVVCVATSVGGIPEAIESGRNGYLVPPGQPDALADAVAEVLLDPALRHAMAVAGRERVCAHFSIDRAVRRVEEIYEHVLG